jgi:hypothetical protein
MTGKKGGSSRNIVSNRICTGPGSSHRKGLLVPRSIHVALALEVRISASDKDVFGEFVSGLEVTWSIGLAFLANLKYNVSAIQLKMPIIRE